jgi:lipoprotein-releasing system permease protein
MDLLRKQKEVTNYTPEINENVFFKNVGAKINGTLSGVDVVNENKVFNIADYIVAGNWNELGYRPDGIILGAELAKTLSLNLDDDVNIVTSNSISKNYKVIGLFRTNVLAVDKSKAYLNINSMRQLLSKNQDYVTDVQINVKDYEQTAPLVNRLAPVIPYKVESWQTSNQQLLAGAQLRDIIAIAVSLTILLVAGFGIYNIMNMTINEKIREIAILKAMGFSGHDIVSIFLTQAIAIGIVGGVVGMLIGYMVSAIVNHVPFKIAGLDTLPMSYRAIDYILAFMFGLLTTLVAGYLPARKASKIDPVVIIRG